MNRNEVRYRIISTLLQAGGPLPLPKLIDGCGVEGEELAPILRELVNDGLVIAGELLPGTPAQHYCWAARWKEAAHRRAADAQHDLRTALDEADTVPGSQLDVESDPAVAFYNHVIGKYQPPIDKQYLVFLQCSVRRPFSSSPSHASMRRAIAVATGCDPRRDFERCPVHVVVLASKIGPVPYELEDTYPANVRGTGIKRFEAAHYTRVRPILAARMAGYVIAHGHNYKRIATFTEGRYAEVMQDAQDIIIERYGETARFPILPRLDGPRVVRMGQSRARQYWARYWIQLCLEIVSWLEPDQRALAQDRLEKLQVAYRKSHATTHA